MALVAMSLSSTSLFGATLANRYSFTGNTNDSAGGNNGVLMNGATVTSTHLSLLTLVAIPVIVLPLVAYGQAVRKKSRKAQDTLAAAKVKGPRYGFSPYFVTDIITNEAPGMIAIRTGATGPNFSHVSACATGASS